MKKSQLLLVGGAIACAAVALALAGDLDPPPGAPAPTMKTNQEIFDAVSALGGGGPVDSGACAPAISGALRALGTIQFSTLPGTGGTTGPFTVYSFKETLNSSAAPSGSRFADNVLVTIDISDSTHRLFRLTNSGPLTSVPIVTIALNDGAQNYLTVALGTVFIKTMSTRMVQRCDGTTAQVADLELQALTVRYTNSAGNFWEINNNTGSGTGG